MSPYGKSKSFLSDEKNKSANLWTSHLECSLILVKGADGTKATFTIPGTGLGECSKFNFNCKIFNIMGKCQKIS